MTAVPFPGVRLTTARSRQSARLRSGHPARSERCAPPAAEAERLDAADSSGQDMSNRTALIDLGQNIGLALLQASADCVQRQRGDGRIDTTALALTSLVQAGVQTIEVLRPQGNTDHLPSFLKRRVVFKEKSEWGRKVSEVLVSLTSSDPGLFDRKGGLHAAYLSFFLPSLFLAAKRRRHLVCALPFPSLVVLRRELPLTVFVPVSNLLHSFKSEDLALPVPTRITSVRDVTLLEEVLASQPYRDYETEHLRLDRIGGPLARAKTAIEKAGRTLCRRFPSLLDHEGATVSVLSVSARLVDTVFGKLPATLADSFASAMSAWVRDRRRLVIYRIDPFVREWLRREALKRV